MNKIKVGDVIQVMLMGQEMPVKVIKVEAERIQVEFSARNGQKLKTWYAIEDI